MPRKIKSQRGKFSPWEFLWPDIMKVINGETKGVHSFEVVAVMAVALEPGALACALSEPKARELATTFTRLYTERPDFTIRLLLKIRKSWQKSSHRKQVQRYIATHGLVPVGGKRLAVNVSPYVQDADIARALGIRSIGQHHVAKARRDMRPPPVDLGMGINNKPLSEALWWLKYNGFPLVT